MNRECILSLLSITSCAICFCTSLALTEIFLAGNRNLIFLFRHNDELWYVFLFINRFSCVEVLSLLFFSFPTRRLSRLIRQFGTDRSTSFLYNSGKYPHKSSTSKSSNVCNYKTEGHNLFCESLMPGDFPLSPENCLYPSPMLFSSCSKNSPS